MFACYSRNIIQIEKMSDPVKSFLAGGCGGMATVVVGQPMDMIKVQLQNQSVTNPMYTGTFDCAKVRPPKIVLVSF